MSQRARVSYNETQLHSSAWAAARNEADTSVSHGEGPTLSADAVRHRANKAAAAASGKEKGAGKRGERGQDGRGGTNNEDGGTDFVVEKLLLRRRHEGSGRVEYKVRWQGFTADADTWEPARNLRDTAQVKPCRRGLSIVHALQSESSPCAR